MTRRYQQNASVETAPLGPGVMVLEPQARRFCALNPASTLIWERLSEPASPEQLADHIVDHFQGVSRVDALRDVEAAIAEMTALGIVVPIN